MNSRYYIRGEDGEEYGPLALEELRAWAAEDRVGEGTPVKLEAGEWKLWEDFPELASELAAPSASFGLRLMAFAVDNVIFILIMTFAVGVVWGGLPKVEIESLEQFKTLFNSPLWQEINSVLQVATLVVHLCYFIICHGRWGRTPGKAIFGLRVVRLDGAPLTWQTASARGIASVFSMSFFYLGYAVALFFPGVRTLHDWLTGTKVVRS